jgi:hypothetical protein
MIIHIGQKRLMFKMIQSCGIHGIKLHAPYLFNANVSGETYDVMLNEVLDTYSDGMPLAGRRIFWFQQDGAPAHFAVITCEWLDSKVPGKWIRRRGPVEWSPGSPDVTPLDFFLCMGPFVIRCVHWPSASNWGTENLYSRGI